MSEIKVNKITPRTACGTTQLGDSGDTFTIPSGATISNSGTATGFGATGAVNWDTASIKTATFTGVSGTGYFCNTTAGVFDIVLPASPSAGDIVGLKDYAGTFATNNLTIDRNGSKLDSNAANRVLNTANRSLTLIYVDSTQGWKSVEEGTGSVGETFIVATGGTPCSGAICGNFRIHEFTGPGTFCVSQISGTAANNAVAYLVVAGGAGSGAHSYAGGGGAGGFREGTTAPIVPYTASPIVAATGLTVTASPYAITVGGGGSSGTGPQCSTGAQGSDSIFGSITSTGGGGGGAYSPAPPSSRAGIAGGSGGGGAANAGTAGAVSPTTSPAQGQAGGSGSPSSGGGGGGATGAGGVGGGCGPGGVGATTNIPGSPISKSTGGVGSGSSNSPVPAAANSGGGSKGHPATGGSGMVVIRYRFQ